MDIARVLAGISLAVMLVVAQSCQDRGHFLRGDEIKRQADEDYRKAAEEARVADEELRVLTENARQVTELLREAFLEQQELIKEMRSSMVEIDQAARASRDLTE